MKGTLARRPSPALVISLLALFVALGGTSYAALSLPRNSVGTAQLKNGAVTKKKVAAGVVPKVMWAVVLGDGSIARSTGGVTVSKLDTGEYVVGFPRDVTECVYTGTVGEPSLSAARGDIDASGVDGNANGVFVETWSPDGTSSNDLPFHLVVVC